VAADAKKEGATLLKLASVARLDDDVLHLTYQIDRS
jgi:hypothetical protein